MKIGVNIDSSLDKDEITVEIKASVKSLTVDNLLSYIKQYESQKQTLLPIKVADRILTIKTKDLIKIEVQGKNLTYYTKDTVIESTGRLYQVLEKLTSDFIQVSRHCVINLDYLDSLETGFAGNMVAVLQFNLKTDVSRKYLIELEKKLGL